MKKKNKIIIVISLLSVLVLTMSVPCFALTNFKSTIPLHNSPTAVVCFNDTGEAMGSALIDARHTIPATVVKQFSSFGYRVTYQGSLGYTVYGEETLYSNLAIGYTDVARDSLNGFTSGYNRYAFGGYDPYQIRGLYDQGEISYLYSEGLALDYQTLYLRTDDVIEYEVEVAIPMIDPSFTNEIVEEFFENTASQVLSGEYYNESLHAWDTFTYAPRGADVSVSIEEYGASRNLCAFINVAYSLSINAMVLGGRVTTLGSLDIDNNLYVAMRNCRLRCSYPDPNSVAPSVTGAGWCYYSTIYTPEISSQANNAIFDYVDKTFIDNSVYEVIKFDTFEPIDWLSRTVGNFLAFEIIPNFPLYVPLIVCISFGIVFAFLKYFAGG